MWSFFLLSFCAGILGSYGAVVPSANCKILFQKDGHNATNFVTAWGGALNHVNCKVYCTPEIPLAPAIQWYRQVNNTHSKRVSVFRKRVYYTRWSFGRTATLTFKNFLESDVGSYVCKAWLGARRGWVNSTVHVRYGCHAPSFQCDNSRCLPPEKHCDGVPDCNDGYDEGYCDDSSCAKDEFACDNKCVEKNFRCDGYYDCDDESDESNCECDVDSELQCGDGTCIDKDKFCDGVVDCNLDANDEENCETPTTVQPTTSAPEPTTTTASATASPSAECFDEEYDYSNYNNLPPCSEVTPAPTPTTTEPTSSETEDCGEDFMCDDGSMCVTQGKLCDNHPDCPDASDETGCEEEITTEAPASSTGGFVDGKDKDVSSTTTQATGTTPAPDESISTVETIEACFPEVELECPDGQCIPIGWKCDGVADCIEGYDELLCEIEEETGCLVSEFGCGEGLCINNSAVCDGHLDCPSGEDEQGCGCDDGEFMCHDNGDCIPKDRLCDQFPDCADESDEATCYNGIVCPESLIACDNLTICYQTFQRCDGEYLCVDMSDEKDCPTSVPLTTEIPLVDQEVVLETVEVDQQGTVTVEEETIELTGTN